jgi:autotransporter passenger strand-loop-strand repeat protein
VIGREDVRGAASGTTLVGGGTEYVSSGGLASGATASSGGEQVVLSAGTASGTTILNGGYQVVSSGGSAVGTTVSNGGREYVEAGAVASFTTVLSGGSEFVSSGGTVSGAALSGGTLEIMSGGLVASSTIGFAGGGTLELDNSQAFPSSATISGFGVPDRIDLRDIAFATATLGYSGNTQSGTLTVTDGAHTAHLALLGMYSAASFHLSPESGGGTGTVVTDPPVSSGASLLTALHS